MIESDVQKVVFRHGGVTICCFRCPPGHERWSRENQIQDGHNVAFPRAFVEIRPAGSRAFLADPNQVVYYNDGDCFHRRLVRDDGDAANVFLFESRHLVDALGRHDPSVVERPGAPFRFKSGPVAPPTYLRQRLLVAEAARSLHPDGLRIVEASLAILDEVVDAAYRSRDRAGPVRKRSTRIDHRERVEVVKRRLSAVVSESVSLEQLAREAGLSVYHMCRIFRRETGLPVYRYLLRLRLRAALDWLADSRRSLVEVALEAGFASQSHFAEAFRREFGQSPGQLRRTLLARPYVQAGRFSATPLFAAASSVGWRSIPKPSASRVR